MVDAIHTKIILLLDSLSMLVRLKKWLTGAILKKDNKYFILSSNVFVFACYPKWLARKNSPVSVCKLKKRYLYFNLYLGKFQLEE